MMTIDLIRKRLLATTMICGVAFASAAFAQTTGPGGTGAPGDPAAQGPDATGNPDSDSEELIVVTGSRIAQPELSSATPLTVVGSEELKLTGTNRVEDLVNNLPQVFAGQNGNYSNGATGIATVNLRGIGASRTLVLVNGKRLVPGDPRTPVADLNFIPGALVSRIDVLTGGASSVYGSDAVAGVVNFIMDTDLEGLRVDGQYSFYQHNNDGDGRVRDALRRRNFPFPDGNTVGGESYQLDAAIGIASPDGRGHATVYAGYRSVAAIRQSERDFSACSLSNVSPFSTTLDVNGFTCAGSGTTAPARFITNNGGAGAQDLTIDPSTTNTLRSYSGARDAFNFAPYNYYQRPDERFTLGGFAQYEVAEYFKPYLEAMFMDDETNAVIAPSGVFLSSQQVNCDNPLLSAGQVAAFCTRFGLGPDDDADIIIGRRNVEGGGRDNDLTHTSYRIVVGARGDLGSDWNYDVYAQYGRTRLEQIYRNDFSLTRIGRSLQVVADPATGLPVCSSVLDGSDINCVPYNIFNNGGVTEGALNYLQTPGFQIGESRQQIVSGSISGQLGQYGLQSPFAERGIGIAIGGEYRDEFLQTNNDTAFQTGDLAGQGGPTVDVAGGFNVAEVFGEVQIPLAEDRPFFDLLQVTAGYRYSDYSTAGSTDTYKVEGVWRPIPGFTLRGGYNRAVRAPNAVELFSPQSVGLFSGTDPCVGPDPVFTPEQCARTGVTAAQYGNLLANPADQYAQFAGGNPDLEPEQSDTYTAGIVLAPRNFLRGLSVTVDYFDIKVENLISTVGAALILNQCGLTGDPALCALVRRDTATGSLFIDTNLGDDRGFVINTNVNIGSLQTKGVDVQAAYRFDFEDIGVGVGGGLGFDFVGTYLIDYIVEPGVVSTRESDGVEFTDYNCVGYYGVAACGTPSPEWRSQLRVTYTSPGGFQASVRWRHYGPVNVESIDANPFLNGDLRPTTPETDVFLADRHLNSRNWFDLAFNVRATDRHSFRVGVNNVFDSDPPIIGSQNLPVGAGNGNTTPNVYDALGRYFFAGFTANF